MAAVALATADQQRQQKARYASDGKLYAYVEFVEFYGPEAPFKWECALPEDMGLAIEKVTAIVQAYESLSFWHGIAPVALYATSTSHNSEHRCAECKVAFSQDSDFFHEGTSPFAGLHYCANCWTGWLNTEQASYEAEMETGDSAAVGGKTVEAERPPVGSWRCIDGWWHKSTEPAAEPEPPSGEENCREVPAAVVVEEVLPPAALMVPFVDKPLRWRRHYDFVEVGTSDWGTLTQFCAGQQNTTHVSWMAAEIRTSIDGLRWTRGLAVEPVKEHLDALPLLPRVAKVEAAMGENSGEATLYCVSAENVARYASQFVVKLPWGKEASAVEAGGAAEVGSLPPWEADVMWYAKSLSSIGKPHPDLLTMLRQVGREDLMEQRKVQVFNWGDLCNQYGIGTVDAVQLDCEGMDCGILRGMLKHCDEYKGALPRLIAFEANHLTDASEVEATLTALKEHGYSIRVRGYSNIIVELYW